MKTHPKAENEVLYRKIGRRYVVATDPWAYTGLRDGFWLVQVRPGSTTIRQPIWPDTPAVEAALRLLEGKLLEELRKAHALRPSSVLTTRRQRKAWAELAASFGQDIYTLSGPSLQEIADKVCAWVKAGMKEDA